MTNLIPVEIPYRNDSAAGRGWMCGHCHMMMIDHGLLLKDSVMGSRRVCLDCYRMLAPDRRPSKGKGGAGSKEMPARADSTAWRALFRSIPVRDSPKEAP